MRKIILVLLFVTAGYALVWAASGGVVRGVVHDPEHRPLSGAIVTISRTDGDLHMTANSDAEGQFRFVNVAPGRYDVAVKAEGFRTVRTSVTVGSAGTAVLHFALEIATVGTRVEVEAAGEAMDGAAVSPERVVTRKELEAIPGATQSGSMTAITDTVPGAVIVHNQLHVRGGHEVEWMVDGVPLPNTDISSNVGPQFDARDVESMDMQRGSYNAEFGDRAYGVFNVIPKAGFDRNQQAELTMGFGGQNMTDDELSFGDHSSTVAYYASAGATRTDAGLETQVPRVLHDQHSGAHGMGSVIYNAGANDQLRFTAGARHDWFQVPNTEAQQAAGVRDTEDEQDTYGIVSWMHTFSPRVATTVSPFYHYNGSNYDGSAPDAPVIPRQERGSNYVGLHSTVTYANGKHDVRAGVMLMGQHDRQMFSLSDGLNAAAASRQALWGNEQALFAEDQWQVREWLTLTGGVRWTRFAGGVRETAVDPRVGVAVRMPKTRATLRAFYGRYYQAPPLLTVDGPTLALAGARGFGFLPLRGERDEQMEFGAAYPVRGWTVESDYYVTRARNYFDHDALGASNIFFPLTLARARLRGWEAVLRSPVAAPVRMTLNYAHSYAEGSGAVSGGLTEFSPPMMGYYFLDHDQRDSMSATVAARLPWRTTASTAVRWGSGFLDGDGPGHLPAHTTLDVALRKAVGERWSLGLTATNIGNSRFLIDRSNTFGGTHYELPRVVYGEVSFRWKY